jgi:hypothetical protein
MMMDSLLLYNYIPVVPKHSFSSKNITDDVILRAWDIM